MNVGLAATDLGGYEFRMLSIIADGRTLSFGCSYGLEFNDVLRKLITTRDEIASFYQRNKEAAQGKLDSLTASFETWD